MVALGCVTGQGQGTHMPLAFPVESASSLDGTGTPGILSGPRRERMHPLELRQKRGSSGCGRDSRASSRVETGIPGNFLSCSKGVKDPLEVPEVRCD